MNSNGFAPPTTPSNELSNASLSATQAPPSLPHFVSTRHAVSDRPTSARGRLEGWDPVPLKHWTTVDPPSDAGSRVGIIGNLTMVAFLLLAIGMAGAAIHQEERLAPHERQLLERAR
jgi:hypothetical protein